MPIIRFEDEEGLVARLKAGDEKAFETVITRLQERFYSIAYGILGSREDAEDAVEASFLEGWRAVKNFRAEASLYSWLYRILVNTCYRIAKAPRAVPIEGNDPPGPSPADLEPAEKALLRQAIAKLPAEYRDALILRTFEGLTYKEIADTLGIKEGTVMSRIHRARSLLQKNR
jgi:RNA polymerase sigma-70 factor (ECF subfamily)